MIHDYRLGEVVIMYYYWISFVWRILDPTNFNRLSTDLWYSGKFDEQPLVYHPIVIHIRVDFWFVWGSQISWSTFSMIGGDTILNKWCLPHTDCRCNPCYHYAIIQGWCVCVCACVCVCNMRALIWKHTVVCNCLFVKNHATDTRI